ncbi:unnamed protein product, partial [marine sediment metagenome]
VGMISSLRFLNQLRMVSSETLIMKEVEKEIIN